MNVSPFLLLKDSTAALISQRTGAALARWAADWAALPTVQIACGAACDSARLATSSNWRQYDGANGETLWVGVEAGLEHRLEQLLFNLTGMDAASETDRPSSIATPIVEDALASLFACLAGEFCAQASLREQPAALPDHPWRYGSGAALCSIDLGGKSIRLLLPTGSVPQPAHQSTRESRLPLSTLRNALACIPVKLSVEVSRTELTLGYLRTLAVGDVLTLPTSVDHALRVAGPGDTTVCHAHLGTLEGFLAIELIKPASQACPDRI